MHILNEYMSTPDKGFNLFLAITCGILFLLIAAMSISLMFEGNKDWLKSSVFAGFLLVIVIGAIANYNKPPQIIIQCTITND